MGRHQRPLGGGGGRVSPRRPSTASTAARPAWRAPSSTTPSRAPRPAIAELQERAATRPGSCGRSSTSTGGSPARRRRHPGPPRGPAPAPRAGRGVRRGPRSRRHPATHRLSSWPAQTWRKGAGPDRAVAVYATRPGVPRQLDTATRAVRLGPQTTSRMVARHPDRPAPALGLVRARHRHLGVGQVALDRLVEHVPGRPAGPLGQRGHPRCERRRDGECGRRRRGGPGRATGRTS